MPDHAHFDLVTVAGGVDLNVSAVPEPGRMALLVAGAVLLGFGVRSGRRQA